MLRLRKALASTSGLRGSLAVGFGPGGYVLVVSDSMDVDVAQFDVLWPPWIEPETTVMPRRL